MIARLAAATSLVVAFSLLLTMGLMVSKGRAAVTDKQVVKIGDFVRIERERVVQTRERKPIRPQEPLQRPQLPSAEHNAHALSVSVSTPALDTTVAASRATFQVSDGELLPIVKVAPVYPQRALARRPEGYVLVELVVTQGRAVKDVVVIDSTAPLFEKPAMEAALKFRCKPLIVNAEPVEVHGAGNKIIFEMAV